MKRVLVLSITMLLSTKTLLPAAAKPDRALTLLTTALDASSHEQSLRSGFVGSTAKDSATVWNKFTSSQTPSAQSPAAAIAALGLSQSTQSAPNAAAATWEWSANPLTGFGYWAGQPVKQAAHGNGPADTQAAKPQTPVQAHATQVPQLVAVAAAVQAAPEASWSYFRPWTWIGSSQAAQAAPVSNPVASGNAQLLAAAAQPAGKVAQAS